MNLSTVATISGSKSHLSEDGRVTLCGREVSNGTDASNPCKTCQGKAAKLTAAAENEGVTDPAAIVAMSGPYLYPACDPSQDVCDGCGAVKGVDQCAGYPEVDNRPAEVKALLAGETVTVAEHNGTPVTLVAAPEGSDTTLTVRVGETVIAQTLTAYMQVHNAVKWAQRELTGWADTRTDAEKMADYLAKSRALALAEYNATTDPAARKLAAQVMINNEGSAPCTDRACTGTLTRTDGLTECGWCGSTPWGDTEGPVWNRFNAALHAEQDRVWYAAHNNAPCDVIDYRECGRCQAAQDGYASIDRASILRAAQDSQRMADQIAARQDREVAEIFGLLAPVGNAWPTTTRQARRQPKRTTRAQRRRNGR